MFFSLSFSRLGRRRRRLLFCRKNSTVFFLLLSFVFPLFSSAFTISIHTKKKKQGITIANKKNRTNGIREEKQTNQLVVEEDAAAAVASAAVSSAPAPPVCVPISLVSFAGGFSLPFPPPMAPLHLGPAASEISAAESLERPGVCCCCC